MYALYGATSGDVAISNINGAINQAILALKPKEDKNSSFIVNWLSYRKENILKTYLQGGQGNLSAKIVTNLWILMPSTIEEQNLIGNLLDKYDNLITSHHRKLEHLEKQKKALLQQMFV